MCSLLCWVGMFLTLSVFLFVAVNLSIRGGLGCCGLVDGDVESFGFASKRGVYRASFTIWSLIREMEPNKSASPLVD